MRYDILANYDRLLCKSKEYNSFVTEEEQLELIMIAEAVDELVNFKDKVSLRNISIITGLPTADLETFIEFILACEEAALRKYR